MKLIFQGVEICQFSKEEGTRDALNWDKYEFRMEENLRRLRVHASTVAAQIGDGVAKRFH